ncbi:hypothetical protein V6Z11_D01G245600 [Gossypium hirsutum]
MLPINCIVLFFLLSSFFPFTISTFNLTFPIPHPNPNEVAQEVQRRVNASISRRETLQTTQKDISSCLTGEANVRSSPTHFGWRTESDGDGISIFGAKDIWIDHCSLSHCKDGLIDAVMGSTGITISNNFFSHHNEVMLLGHSDEYEPDSGMQVTIAFNHFGEKLVQRMPRCRRGYIHVVNNDFTQWEMYAIGGSGNPTINSQGNRYTAPTNPNAKQVTKRVDTDEGDWKGWNWRSEGDVMVNGAFFVASGEGVEFKYEKAYSVEPKSAVLIDQLTMHSGVLGVGGRDNNLGKWSSGVNGDGSDFGSGEDEDDDYSDDMSGSNIPFSTAFLPLFIAMSSFLLLCFEPITSPML